MKLNTWKSVDSGYALLRNGDELLYEINKVMQYLIDKALDSIKNDSFDELMDFLEECTEEELNLVIKYCQGDDRLVRCIDIINSK